MPCELSGAQMIEYAQKLTLRSRLPPRQLPILAVYASSIVYAAEKGWIPTAAVGKAGASIVGVLSMGRFYPLANLKAAVDVFSDRSSLVSSLLLGRSQVGRGQEDLDSGSNQHKGCCPLGTLLVACGRGDLADTQDINRSHSVASIGYRVQSA